MKKFFYITTGIAFFTASSLFAASFTIDDLNLREAIPNVNLPAAHFKINLESAWNKINELNLSLSPITTGIIDSGVDVTHEEFNGINWGKTPASAKIDFGDNRGDSHGTNVAGIIGANNISATSSANYVLPQMNGVLSGVKNLNYTLENRGLSNVIQRKIPGSIFSIAAKIQDIAKNEGQIINISQETDNVLVRLQEFVRGTLEKSFSSHPSILFIVSAGNDGKPVENSLPARLSTLLNVITVGATTIDDMRYTITQDGKTTGSNYGNSVSISAPGDAVFSPTFYGKPDHYPPMISDYESFSGTSASAPLVTGVAGLLKAIKPSLTPAQIKDILIRTADPIQTGETDKRLGKGCYTNPDDPINTGCRLNALAAVCDPDVLNCAPSVIWDSGESPFGFALGWDNYSFPLFVITSGTPSSLQFFLDNVTVPVSGYFTVEGNGITYATSSIFTTGVFDEHGVWTNAHKFTVSFTESTNIPVGTSAFIVGHFGGGQWSGLWGGFQTFIGTLYGTDMISTPTLSTPAQFQLSNMSPVTTAIPMGGVISPL
jgi:hypothetical protein